MAFKFGKRKEEDVDDFDTEEDVEEGSIKLKGKKIKDKDFKDLKSENKKARVEVQKPWGKKERFIVLAFFLATTIISAILGLSSRKWKLPGFPRFGVPNIELPVINQKKIIMEENNLDLKKTKEAKDSFLGLISNLTGVYALRVVRLKNGSGYGVNEDTKITAASLIKLPTLAALYQESETQGFDLDGKYVLINEDKVGGSGSLSRKPAGYEITFRNLANLMGKQSDNTAFNIVRKTLGDVKINAVITKAGMSSTSLENNQTTASDISRYFESLWSGNLVSGKSRDEILGFLTDTIYESWLAAGIPEGIEISHKYGREVHVVNDGGIVKAKEPYVIVVLSEGIVDKEADETLPKISKSIYEIETAK